MQLTSRHFEEQNLFDAGAAVEKLAGFGERSFRMSYSDWEPVIGLEIHAQLLTESKMFSPDSTHVWWRR